jgi:hypothetical protein
MRVERLRVEEFEQDEYSNLLNKLDFEDAYVSSKMLANKSLWADVVTDEFNEEMTLA